MAETREKGMLVRGTCNGTTDFVDKQGVVHYSVLIVLPNMEQALRVSLRHDQKPHEFVPGSDIEMKILPRYFNGRPTGYVQAN